MARVLGFEGYDDFREPFREEIRRARASFPDRARWLQSFRARRTGPALCRHGQLGPAQHRGDVRRHRRAPPQGSGRGHLGFAQVFHLGVGVNNANARNFTYLASTGMEQFHAIPRPGSTAIDDLAWADSRDVLIAMTCKPYRTEVVEAVQMAREQGVTVIGISDSPASPVVIGSDIGFVAAVDTPQFFPSSVSTIALLETLLSFVIASASERSSSGWKTSTAAATSLASTGMRKVLNE
jgi:DNA-binding MurR/RpiR family transcriptional regulator